MVQAGLTKVAFATMLTGLSGFVDAVGYSALGHLYLSFMSGNSTHFGMSIAQGDWRSVLLASSIIATFVLGCAAGVAIADRAGDSLATRVLDCELLIVATAIALLHLGFGQSALIPIAAAMGMQNALHQVVAGAELGRGFITGSLFGLGSSLARLKNDPAQAAAAFQYAWSWFSFISGVCLGALSHAALGLTGALGFIAMALCALTLAVRVGTAARE